MRGSQPMASSFAGVGLTTHGSFILKTHKKHPSLPKKYHSNRFRNIKYLLSFILIIKGVFFTVKEN